MDAETSRTHEGQRSESVSEGDRVHRRFRPQLSYANVMSTLAVFIALGGSSYAAVTLNGSNIKYRSVSGTKLKRNTLTKLEIRESQLGTVPKAKVADRLSASGTQELKVRCPDKMVSAAGTCVEIQPRGRAHYGGAVLACRDVNEALGPRRRLPTHGELMAALVQDVVGFTEAELTSDVYPSSTISGGLDVLYVTDRVGSVGLTTNDFNGTRAFRCAVDPTN